MNTTIVKPEDIAALIKSVNAATAVIDRALAIGLIKPETFEAEKEAVITRGTPKTITVSEAIIELIAAKKLGARAPYYISGLKKGLDVFAHNRGSTPLAEITVQEIEIFIARYENPRSRQTYLRWVSVLFGFAVKRGYVPFNPCARIESILVTPKAPTILTPVQVQKLVDTCERKFLPCLVFSLYAGIRPYEVQRLDWKQIDLATATVKVDLGKTRRRRIVKLEPIAVKLLTPLKKDAGPVCPTWRTVVSWKQRVRKILGFKKFPQDLFRHCSASYLMALHKDAGRVATILGHSVDVLVTHYHEPVTDADCKAFWKI